MSVQRDREKMRGAARFALERIQVTAIAVAVFALPLIMWPGLTDYNYAKCIVSLILISVLLVLWGLTAWRRASWTIRIPWLLVPVFGFVLAGVLSLIQATNGRVVVQSLILLIYFVLLLWMIANVVRDQRDVRWLLTALLASGFLAALYGVLQYFGIVPGNPGATGVNAIISTMGNRNHLGGFLLYLFYPAVILLFRVKARWAKALTVISIALSLAVVLLVRQVGTQITLVLVTGALAVGWLIFLPVKRIRANRWWFLAFAGAVIAMCLYVVIFVPLNTANSSDTVSEKTWLVELWEDNSGSARAWFWWIGAEMLADHPITGVGLGNYKLDFFPYKADFSDTERGQAYDFHISRVSQAHSELVQTGAEFGSVGLFMLLCSLGTLAVSLWIRLKRSNKADRRDLLLLTAGILAFLVHGLVSFPAHVAGSSLELMVFCGLALSVGYGKSMTFSWTLDGWKGRAIHAVLVVIAFSISLFAVADLRANWLMERGISQVEERLHAAGEITLQRSLELDFAPRQTYFYLAIAQIQLGKLDEAEENLEKCMTRFLDEGVYLTYADLEVNLGELEKAQAAVDVLLKGHPRSLVEQQARYIEAVIAIQGREYDRALQLLESLTQDHASYEAGFVTLGQLYAAQGLTNSARRNFETALRLIDRELRNANAKLEAGSVVAIAEYGQIRAEIELLTQQREYVAERLREISDSSSP